jgi:hypothetical protein
MSLIEISNLNSATEDSFLTELQDTDATQIVGGTVVGKGTKGGSKPGHKPGPKPGHKPGTKPCGRNKDKGGKGGYGSGSSSSDGDGSNLAD